MRFIINGVDAAAMVKQGSFQWMRNDVDSEESGRNTMDGRAHRDRMAMKVTLSAECIPLTEDRSRALLNAIEPTFFPVEYDDPMVGPVIRTMYCATVPVAHQRTRPDGREVWCDIKLELVER